MRTGTKSDLKVHRVLACLVLLGVAHDAQNRWRVLKELLQETEESNTRRRMRTHSRLCCAIHILDSQHNQIHPGSSAFNATRARLCIDQRDVHVLNEVHLFRHLRATEPAYADKGRNGAIRNENRTRYEKKMNEGCVWFTSDDNDADRAFGHTTAEANKQSNQSEKAASITQFGNSSAAVASADSAHVWDGEEHVLEAVEQIVLNQLGNRLFQVVQCSASKESERIQQQGLCGNNFSIDVFAVFAVELKVKQSNRKRSCTCSALRRQAQAGDLARLPCCDACNSQKQ